MLFESGGFFSFFRTLGSSFSGDAILYLAGAPSPAETERSSHLSGRIKVLPLSRTQGSIPEWVQMTRNVRDDYVTLFGKEPRNVTAVAFMTDTENSQTECVSYFRRHLLLGVDAMSERALVTYSSGLRRIMSGRRTLALLTIGALATLAAVSIQLEAATPQTAARPQPQPVPAQLLAEGTRVPS